MTEGEFPFRSFTMRSEGYDRGEVDTYVDELQREIVEQRRALETATAVGESDARLHDPEGAVTRTLAIAQETADRVLHDAQVDADRRRTEADEHATNVVAEADERAARMLGDMEAQAAEVREQGVAAARSAIQVERDKAMAELSHVRRVRDDLRTEAVDLKAALDLYRSQAREASDSLAAVSSGPLMSLDLPDFIDDDVVLAGIGSGPDTDQTDDEDNDNYQPDADSYETDADGYQADADSYEAEADGYEVDSDSYEAGAEGVAGAEETVIIESADSFVDVDPVFAAEPDDASGSFLQSIDDSDTDELAEVISIDTADEATPEDDGLGGTFLAEVRAAAEDDDVALPPENEGSDRFLSELRGIADESSPASDLDSEAADTFFDD